MNCYNDFAFYHVKNLEVGRKRNQSIHETFKLYNILSSFSFSPILGSRRISFKVGENAQRFQINGRGLKKHSSGRTTPESHFHAKRQFRFLVKPVLAAKLRLLPTGRNEAHYLQTILKVAIKVMAIQRCLSQELLRTGFSICPTRNSLERSVQSAN